MGKDLHLERRRGKKSVWSGQISDQMEDRAYCSDELSLEYQLLNATGHRERRPLTAAATKSNLISSMKLFLVRV